MPARAASQVRKVLQTLAFLGPALALWPLASAASAGQALLCFTVALGMSSFGQVLECAWLAPA